MTDVRFKKKKSRKKETFTKSKQQPDATNGAWSLRIYGK